MSATAPPAKLLVLMPWGRVGSNLLVMMLQDSLPDGSVKFANEPIIRQKRAELQTAWLETHFAAAAPDLALVACKSSIRATADIGQLARDCERLGLSLLRHRRINLVKVAVSVLRARLYAERTKGPDGRCHWGVLRGASPLPPVALDPDAFVSALRNAGRADDTLAQFAPACPTFDLTYAELQADPRKATRRVLDWLGLAATREARPRFVKATADDLAKAVPNLDELRRAAGAAGLERYDGMFVG